MLTKLRPHVSSFLCAALLAASSSALAQTTPVTPKPKLDKEERVELSPFEVTMTQDKGYNVTNSGMALRTNETLMEIPQSISVITRDMIEDIASENVSDFVNYSGGSNFFQGDSAMLRGVRVSMYADGIVDYNFDPVTTDSITVVRGPVGVLYGVGLVGNLGGAILKNTRTPTRTRSGSVLARVDQHGFMRAEVDYSDVIGSVGDAKFSYRVDLAHQRGKFYWNNLSNDADVGYIVVEMKRPANTLRLNYTHSDRKADPHRNFFLTPDGVPYFPANNPKESYMPADISKIKRKDRTFRALFNQHLGGGWNMALRGAYSYNYYNHEVILANFINWQTREVIFQGRNNNLGQDLYSGSVDVTGDYTLFGLKQKTVLGLAIEDNTNLPNAIIQDNNFGTLNEARGVGRAVNPSGDAFVPGTRFLAMPIDNPRMNEIILRPSSAFVSSAVTGTFYGSRQERVVSNMYVQQNVEVLKDRLTVIGSLAKYSHVQESTNRPYVQPAALTSTVTRANDLLHRAGFVFMLNKEIGFYGLDSTAIIPQAVRLFDGSFSPNQFGRGQELGIKTNLLDGRVSATAAVFKIELDNVAVGSGLTSPVSGLPYSNLIGKTTQKGWDLTLFVKPLPEWQVTFNFYQGTVRDQNGFTNLPITFEGAWSVFTRYNFQSDALKKFAIGGGANRQHNRTTTGSTMRLENGLQPPTNGTPGVASAMKIKDGTMMQVWVDFKLNRHWTFKFHVNNVLDENFAVGHQHAAAIDPSQPRTFQVVGTYRF